MKRILSLVAIFGILVLNLTGCQETEVDQEVSEIEEEAFELSFSQEELDYYQRYAEDDISINVYNWGEYIPDGSDDETINLNAEFTKLTGIKVNYTTYASNEEMYAKLKGGGASYDIIIPSDYMISRMIKEDMLEEINFENIPAFENIMDKFKVSEYDPDGKFSVPYTWGTVCIIYDNTAVDIPEDEIDWDILWNEEYKDSVLMFDNPRDAFAIAEIMLGYSMNTEDSKELEKAAQLLTEQKSVIQAYVMDEIFDKMGAGEAIVAPYYTGDGLLLMDEFDHLSMVIPKSGTNLFVDAVCIPKGAKQKTAAEMYINFLCESEIACSIAEYIGYSTPNQGAFDLLDPEITENKLSYPDDEFIQNKTTVFRNLSDEANEKMQVLWTNMKSAEKETTNKWIVPVFMLICVLLSIGILIRRYIKSKKDIF